MSQECTPTNPFNELLSKKALPPDPQYFHSGVVANLSTRGCIHLDANANVILESFLRPESDPESPTHPHWDILKAQDTNGHDASYCFTLSQASPTSDAIISTVVSRLTITSIDTHRGPATQRNTTSQECLRCLRCVSQKTPTHVNRNLSRRRGKVKYARGIWVRKTWPVWRKLYHG